MSRTKPALVSLADIAELVGMEKRALLKYVEPHAANEATLALYGKKIPLRRNGRKWWALRSSIEFLL